MKTHQTLANPSERLPLGFIGGGLESGIAATHRYAAQLDGHYQLVAGVFSSNPERNFAAGRAYGIAEDRIYSNYQQMAESESQRADGIVVAVIMVPNMLHVPVSRVFIEHGIDVICDKPLATNLHEALSLQQYVAEHSCTFVLTHNYSGFPMAREARARIAAGEIGQVRLVQVEHAGAFGADLLEQQGLKRMAWRTDANTVGASAILADVGVHAHHLLRFVTGLEVEQVCADLTTMVPGRVSDDNAHVLLRLNEGVRGMLWASFVAAGHRQGLQIRVFGSTGSLSWHQEDPDLLVIRPQHAPHFILRRGEAWLGEDAAAATRMKAGQVEGQLEAFANIYSDAAELIRARRAGRAAADSARLCPGIADGVAGMRFIAACTQSQRENGSWTSLAGAE
ncbi:Gfo/Idh/MocA family protein [Undibacterium sp. SXout7W]|uniref:Gfo/Idh/MocA family protein n=1 Tax=Undibacterium sp. SXout7W TaxID=3413049 RepID=UPI003BF0398F